MVNYRLLLKEVEALEKIVEDAYGDTLYVDENTIKRSIDLFRITTSIKTETLKCSTTK